MSGHLRAVPDPQDEDAATWPVPVHGPAPVSAAAAPAVPAPPPHPPDVQVEDFPGESGGLEDAGDEEGEDEAEEAGEQPTGRRPFSMPDLSPYYDVRPLAELGPIAVQVGKHGAPPLLHFLRGFFRDLVRMVTWYARGIGVLLALGAAWLNGSIGKRGSVGARMGGAGFVLYSAYKLSTEYPAAPYVILALVLVVVVMAARGDIKPPEKKAPEKKGAKDGKGKTTATTKGKGKAADKAAAEVEEKAPTDKPRPGPLARLANRRQSPAATPAQSPVDAPVEDPAGSPAEAGEEDDEPPTEDPLTALIRKEIGGENGVHLKDLRPAMRKALPALSGAADEELRATLVRAGYDPSRKFRARGVAGRAGVPRTQLPPLPSPGVAPGPPGDHSPGGGERLPPANSSASGEQRRVVGEWTKEDLDRGWRWVQDPARPSAWVIEQLSGGA